MMRSSTQGAIVKLRAGRWSRITTTALTVAFVLHQPLSPATITVGGGCTLDEAILAANGDSAVGGCSAGSGLDTIELTADVVLSTALPTVTGETVFEGNDFTIGRDGSALDFRILDLSVAGEVILQNLTITNGSAVGSGGGIYNNAAYLQLFNAQILSNEATGRGGGIMNGYDAFDVTTVNSTLADNTAGSSGGAIYSSWNALIAIDSSTISGNVSGDNGGGLGHSDYSYPTVTNSTLSGNVATNRGGAISSGFYSGVTTLISSTVVGNTASTGGGVYAYPNFSSPTPAGHYTSVELTNTLLGDNVGGNCVGVFQDDFGGNFDDDGTCLGASPVAAGVDFDDTLANNGGPTLTHALLPGSAAINAGGACGIADDQRGFSRDILCDSGAVEFGAAPVGGSLFDVRGITATCRNVTTGQNVTISLAGSTNTWDCESAGLVVSAGDTITQVLQGGGIDGAGGTVIGLAADRVSCRNQTTAQVVNIDLGTGPSWDCAESGFVVNPGDRIRMVSMGTVP